MAAKTHAMHGRDHSPGGMDPIPSAAAETKVACSVGHTGGPTSITTPWNYQNLVPLNGFFSTTDAGVFSENGTYDGAVDVHQDAYVNIRCYQQIQNNNASKLIPCTIEVGLTVWDTASGAPTDNQFDSDTHRSYLLPAGAVDTKLVNGAGGFWVGFWVTDIYVSTGNSYGFWLHATDATANWYLGSGASLYFTGYLV